MQIEFSATTRVHQGTGASRRLRRAGRVPGVLYGGNHKALSIDLDHNEIFHHLKLEAFHASILSMTLDGKKQPVLLRDVQMHAYKRQIIHLDFQRVEADQKVHVKVPLHFVNAESAPGVKLQGGIVSHVMNDVEVSCLPADLPEFIEVDLKELSAGKSLHTSDLVMPKGVERVAHRGEDPVVATILLPRGTGTEEAAAGEEQAAAAPAAAPAAPAPSKTADKKG
jgi:large subunit ribosomal protein L25